MIEFDALYYDGRTSARRPVRVCVASGSLKIVGQSVDMQVPLERVNADPPIGSIRRMLRLPDGGQLQTDDAVAIAELFPRANRMETWIHVMERGWGYALAATIVAGGFIWWTAAYGLPVAAQLAAGFVPVELEKKLGDQALLTLDGRICKPSSLDVQRQKELREGLATLSAGLGDGYAYRLELRACPDIGPNAFALPGGAIIVTDDLVKLAQNDRQILAVLAHEIGHVSHRHGLRLALQASGLAALIATVAGDAASITSLAVALPTVLLQSSYSREFEDEADGYAFQRLKAVGLSPLLFAEIIARMEEYRDRKAGAKKRSDNPLGAGDMLDYLASHPATGRRIQRAIDSAR